MAPPKSLLFLAAAASLVVLSAATQYTVGAAGGSWDLQTKLSLWASSISFKPGDSLLFSYNPSSHDVVEVTKANFDSCSTTGNIKTYTSGKDVITLTAAGKRYFICGFTGHCDGGMKVEIDTAAAGGSPSPSSGSASPPVGSTPSTPGTGSSPSGPSASTPPSAASRVGLEGKMVASLGVGMLIALAI